MLPLYDDNPHEIRPYVTWGIIAVCVIVFLWQAVLDDPSAMKNAVSEIPWGRFGKPEEVAGLAVFLAGDEAEYVTGSTYYIDGGLTQQVTLY